MLRFNLRSRIDLIKPSDKVINYTNTNPLNCSIRELRVGDKVQIRYYQNKTCKWKFGKIIKKDGFLHYLVDIDGQIQRRHINQIRNTLVEGNTDGYTTKVQLNTKSDVPPGGVLITNDANDDVTTNVQQEELSNKCITTSTETCEVPTSLQESRHQIQFCADDHWFHQKFLHHLQTYKKS